MKFLELFQPITKGNFGLTEEAIYKSIQLGNQLIPLWGGNKEHTNADRFVDEKAKTKYDDPITVFDGEGIIISLDGSAGNMTYKNGERFALNHHAGFFRTKDEPSDLIDAEFFSIFYPEQLRQKSISEGSKTLTLDMVYSMDFDIPPKGVQLEVMAQMKKLLGRGLKIQRILERMRAMRNRSLSAQYSRFQMRDVSVKDVLDYVGGNSGLTEKEIYQKVSLEGEKYRVLSGSTFEETQLGKVPVFFLNGRPIKIFRGKQGILIVRKGKAGSSRFLEKDNYTLTDDAYILLLRDDCPYEVSLKWFAIQYSNIFYDYSSSSDNGTWNMTGFFENARVDIPEIGEQRAIVSEYQQLEYLYSCVEKISKMIRPLFSRIFADAPNKSG